MAHGPRAPAKPTSVVRNIQELIALLRTPDCGLGRLARNLASGELQAYLETRRELEEPLRRQAGALLERLGDNPRLALFALLHRLTDDPLELTIGVAIHSLAEIDSLVAPRAAERGAVLAALRALLADGRLGEWLRARDMPGGECTLAAVETARRAYPREPDLPLHVLLWRLAPELGLPVGDEWLITPKALVAWMDRDPAHRERGLALLDRGWIPTWLVAVGRLEDPRRLVESIPPGLTPGARAENLLWLLDPDRPGPRVVAEPARLSITVSEDSGETRVPVTLRSTGPGHAWGEVDLRGAVRGVALVTETFDGAPANVVIRVTPDALPGALPRDLALVIRVRGPRADQTLHVPIRLRLHSSFAGTVRRAFGLGAPHDRGSGPTSVSGRLGASLLFGVVFGTVMGLVRVGLGLAMPGGSVMEGLDWVSHDQLASFVFGFGEHGSDRSETGWLANPYLWFGVSAGIWLLALGSLGGLVWIVARMLRGCAR